MIQDIGEQLIETEVRRSPALIDLVRPLSLALRAEIELVRGIRLQLLPRSDPGLEADLWSSRLLQARDANAVVLLPEVRQALHRRLRRRVEELDTAWELIQEYHRELDPVVLREEETAYWALRGDLVRSERQLGAVIHALRRNPRDSDLQHWTRRFLERLPEAIRDSEAAGALRQEHARSTEPLVGAKVAVGLRRLPDGLLITLPPEARALVWNAPLTDPLAIHISWPVAEGWQINTTKLSIVDPTGLKRETFLSTPPGRLRLGGPDQRKLDLYPEGQRPLLYVRLDDELEDLPQVLTDQLRDLDWRHEVVRWSWSISPREPEVQLFAWVDEEAWPLKSLYSTLQDDGFRIQIWQGNDIPVQPTERIAKLDAVIVIYDERSFGYPHIRDLLKLTLEERNRRGGQLRIVTVPADRKALAAAGESPVRDRLLLETTPISPDPADEQIRKIREILGSLRSGANDATPPSGEAAASLICTGDIRRIIEFDTEKGGGFTHWNDLFWSLSHDQKVLLLGEKTVHPVTGITPSGSGARTHLFHFLEDAVGGAASIEDPMELRRALRDHLVRAERDWEAKRVQEYLTARFRVTDEERKRLARARVIVNGQRGFLLYQNLAVIQREAESEPLPTATALFGEEPTETAEANLLRFDGNLVLYELVLDQEREGSLKLAEDPVEFEAHCCALVSASNADWYLAGVVRDSNYADEPGEPHVLEFRTPDGQTLEGAMQVFGPLLRDGRLIGVVYQLRADSDRLIAFALPLDRLSFVLAPIARAILMDRRLLRPNGNWGPAENRLDPAPGKLRDSEHHNGLWIFSEHSKESEADSIQLDLYWQRLADAGREAAEAAEDAEVQVFPPNSCFELVEELASQAMPPAESAREWLDRSPRLTPAEENRLQAYAEALLHGEIPPRPGLRWLLHGVDLEAMSERADDLPVSAKYVSPQASEQARQRGLNGHFGTVRSLVLSKDGALALSAGNSSPDRTVKLWDLRRGRQIHSLADQAEEGGRTALAISEMFFATARREEILLWSLETGDQIQRLKQDVRSPWVDICFVGDDTLLAAEKERIWLIELTTGDAQMLDLGSGETIAVAASDDGELVSVRQRGSLNVLQITKGRLEVVDRLEIPSPGDLFAFQRPPLRFTEDHRLRLGSPQMVWEAGAGARPEEKQSLANIADLAADGMALWAISPGSFQLIGVDGVALSPELQCNGREIACSALSADGSTAMAADYDHNLWVWWLGERNASYEESTLA